DFDLFIKNYALIENLLTHYEALNEVIVLNMAFVLEHFDEVSLWLNSKEFKEKYEDINHPYPPLLNPDKLNDENYILNYEKIPANLAWEMNLPLPRRYEFVFWGSHGVGNFGLSTFLKKLNLNLVYYTCQQDSSIDYKNIYKELICKDLTHYLSIRNFTTNNKFFQLLPPQISSLHLVRDPISVLKHHINFNWKGKNYISIIPFGTSCKDIMCNRIGYVPVKKGPTSENPSLECIERLLDNSRSVVFHDAILYKTLKNANALRDIYIIDMSEIINNRAFETMTQLAKKFNFNFPKIEDLNFYNTNIGSYNTLLPINIKLRKEYEGNIIFCLHCKARASIMNMVNCAELIGLKHEKFSIFVDQVYLKDFREYLVSKQNLNSVKKYVNDMIKALNLQKEIEDKKKFNENDLLKFFKENKNISQKFKNILDEEMALIKQNRPDIVASWKYYKEFEKMCENL
ncbi:DUF2972 domain-containing protein, partial [Campylobacter upsaliensis]|nr:DUF2972 domain-containing protein [Campylobacter upsaliensis]